MKNKYRLSFMIVLIIMLFMYMMDIVEITEETNFAFTLAALILSASMAVDTFSKQKQTYFSKAKSNCTSNYIYYGDLCVISYSFVPEFKKFYIFEKIDEYIRYQCLIVVSTFFYICRTMGYRNKD